MPIGNITSSTGTAAPSGDNLAAAAVAQNLAAAPDIDRLTQLVQQINQQAYLAAPGRQQQLGNIENMMAGNLDPQTIQENQLQAAQRYGSSGFGLDSGAWQSAIQRAMGLSRQALQERGGSALNAMYADMPKANAQEFMVGPALVQQQRAQAAALAEQARQFNIQSAQSADQFTRNLAQRAAEAAQAAALAASELAEKQREFNETMSYTAGIDLQRLQENARQANQQADITRSELAQHQAQFTASQAQQASQFGQSQAQQASQFGQSQAQRGSEFAQTLAQRQAETAAGQSQDFSRLYASLYGTIPGYNQFGIYTGQIGGMPTAGVPATAGAPMPNPSWDYVTNAVDRLRQNNLSNLSNRAGWWTGQP